MPRALKPPSYLKHLGHDGVLRARTVLRLPNRKAKGYSLGKWGSPESYAEHERLVALWRAEWAAIAREHPSCLGLPETVAELVDRFFTHVRETYKRADGSEGTEVNSFRQALRPLVRLFAPCLLTDFGPKNLKLVRVAIATGSWLSDDERAERMRRGVATTCCRRVVNRHTWRLKRLFDWASSEGFVSGEKAHSMHTVDSLRAGELGVRETDETAPVPTGVLDATMPLLSGIVRTMVRVQLLTGMRPGELVRLTPGDLQMDGSVDLGKGFAGDTHKCWAYTPREHKNAWRNQRRIILFSPAAQQLLTPLLQGRPADRPIFSPIEATADRRKEQREARKTKVQPSQQCRKKPTPRKLPRDRYSVGSYNRAVRRACETAFPPPAPLARHAGESKKAWRMRLTAAQREELRRWTAEHSWHVHQLRHNSATHVAKEFGLDVARAVLGHAVIETTLKYALADVSKAAAAMSESPAAGGGNHGQTK
jgi:integrase